MRRILFYTLLCSFLYSPLKAQDLELHAYTGWMFGGAVNYSYLTNSGKIKNKDAQNFGLNLNYRLPSIVMLELGYMRMDSELEFRGVLGETRNNVKMSTEYYQIGAHRELSDGQARPYGLFTLGAVRYHPKESGYSDEWRFSFNAGLGVKLYLGEAQRIALRFQGRLLVPVNWAGVGLYCGTGGCGAGVNAGSTVVEGDLTGGLVVVLK